MERYYPHKQTILISVICIIIVGGVFMYTKQGTNSEKTAQTPTISTNTRHGRADTMASTSDWRLSFIDKSPATTPKAPSNSTKEDLTLTDQFGRDFFARYIQLKQSNLIENQQFVTDTLNQSIYNASQAAEQARIYSLNDISTISTPIATDIRAYGNTIGSIFSTYGIDADPAVIANDAFEKGDLSLLAQIDPVIASYETIVSMLKSTRVPQPLAAYHLSLLNAMSGMSKISRDIRALENDPMQTMVSVSSYKSMQDSLIASLKNMRSYFVMVGISFETTEPGSLFALIL